MFRYTPEHEAVIIHRQLNEIAASITIQCGGDHEISRATADKLINYLDEDDYGNDDDYDSDGYTTLCRQLKQAVLTYLNRQITPEERPYRICENQHYFYLDDPRSFIEGGESGVRVCPHCHCRVYVH